MRKVGSGPWLGLVVVLFTGDFGGRRGTALPAACVRTSNATGIMVFYYRTPSASQAFGCTLEPGRS